MYADNVTDSMKNAIDETRRRRQIQDKYNQENGIIPRTIKKDIRPPIHVVDDDLGDITKSAKKKTRTEIQKQIKELEKQMKQAAHDFEFERAAELRDIIFELKAEL